MELWKTPKLSLLPPEPERAQTLSEIGLQHEISSSLIPERNTRQPETVKHKNRPYKASDSGVPVIDLFNFDPQHSDQLRYELRRACKDWGSFQIMNHGVPKKLLDDMRNAGRSFFNDCSMEEKRKYSCDSNSAASEGYGSRMLVKDDSVLDWRDYFDHHTLPLSRRNPNRWPSFYRFCLDVMVEYSDHMKVLALKLLSMISEGLNLPSSFIEDTVGEIYQNITISYYPPCPQPDLTLGLQSHSDMGAITLLIQDDVEGLHVLKDGEWVTVQSIPDAIVVILADQTEIITNGHYRSSQHRAVTNAHQARLSVATFHDPAKSRKILPAAYLTNENCPARYREVVYGDYVSSWYTKGPEGKRNIDALLL
ncbi:Dmr6-like oxygenase [Thalictrum thalictroides]|uniref:Dmr6-like oxygenase n=1 Tax=Thalictrum thalictroides TaxID=46969 RepID=A0A7J6UR12_THATH|nr:Dmr6-like oxygenase [Thalictrum thalictroides]